MLMMLSRPLLRNAALLALFTALTFDASAQAPATPAPDGHTPPVSDRIDMLAHRLLAAALKSNGLSGDDMKPWHIKVDFQMLNTDTTPKPVSGTFEEWFAGPNHWRRTYTSSEPSWNGTEWSISKTERYQAKARHVDFDEYLMTLRVGRPAVDPLYQAENITPQDDLKIQRATTAGIVLNCTSLVSSSRLPEGAATEWFVPTMCFDPDVHLRLIKSEETLVQFDDLQPFQGRTVARDVKVIDHGRLLAEMKVSLLEPLDTANQALLNPPRDAVPQPYVIEPGSPHPEPVYEVGVTIPLLPNGQPFRGTLLIPAVIRKDGSVKILHAAGGSYMQDVLDAANGAVARWKFKPYLVDGQPVDARYDIRYPIDGKPFVPSYDRPKPAPVASAPDDFSSIYDPKRDPQKDLAAAQTQASAAHKDILVEVGGTWCSWCKILDTFFDEHPDIKALRDQNFVLMKVNMSPANENHAFLDAYPKIPGYPWIFVLDSTGKLIASKSTNDLENGANGYSAKAINAFLASFKPQ